MEQSVNTKQGPAKTLSVTDAEIISLLAFCTQSCLEAILEGMHAVSYQEIYNEIKMWFAIHAIDIHEHMCDRLLYFVLHGSELWQQWTAVQDVIDMQRMHLHITNV